MGKKSDASSGATLLLSKATLGVFRYPLLYLWEKLVVYWFDSIRGYTEFIA